jgi:L,D-transpeptidase catalytic domain/Putative peptidoglycan binding domain
VIERVKTAGSATGRGLRRVFWHKWLLIVAVVVLVALGGVAAAAYGYDRSQSDMIAKGVRVGGIPIGGMSADQARAVLNAKFKVLQRPIVLTYPGGHVRLSPKQAQLRVDVEGLVNQALAESHHGWFLSRAWRELTGGKVRRVLRPHVRYSKAAVNQTIVRIQNRVEREPTNARLNATYNGLIIHGGKNGVQVKAALLRWQIRHSLLSRHARRWYRVPTRPVVPETTIATLRKDNPSFITIDRSAFTLRVFQNLKLARSYTIAVGQQGLETPAGLYHVQDKQVDPWWHVPKSAWAGDLAGKVIPPGPSDPLKARWLGIYNGAGIHGTEELSSLGSAASHGCVRMSIPDVIDLYDRVEVGTPIYIGD